MLNHIVIMGRMTRDPELRKTQGGTSVASFTLEVDRDLTPKGGEKETDFIDCVACLLRSWRIVFTSAKERNLRSRRTRQTPAGLR